MKNLKLLFSKCFSSKEFCNATILCVDSDTNNVYFVGADEFCIYCLDNVTSKVNTISCSGLSEEFLLKGSKFSIVAMDYVLEKQELCLVNSSGDILTCNPETQECEIIGSVESGIFNAAWSPDQELLTIITSADTFIIMTSDFDPLVEKDLHPSEFGESKPITVGWGSKETQFHGSEGKNAAKKKAAEVKPVVAWDDRLPRVSWRGDGELFVTSVVDPALGCRVLRVWSREGNLQYTSEMKDGLEHPLCWRPSGNLITCTQQLPNKHQVIFFEKNGLQYGEFSLPFEPNSFLVKEVAWNSDSSILAIWGHKMVAEGAESFHVLLWSMKNYHWYLKQHLDFTAYGNLVVKHIFWDLSDACKLHVLCNNGLFFQYNWGWTCHHSLGSCEPDDVPVTVIDNDTALVTPFRKMMVPPPMCSYSIKVPCSISSLAYAPAPLSENFAIILSDGRIALCVKHKASHNQASIPNGCQLILNAAGGNGFRSQVIPHSVVAVFSVSTEDCDSFQHYPLFFTHWTWVARNQLLCISSQRNEVLPGLFSVTLPDQNTEEKTALEMKFCGTINEPLIGMCSNQNGTVVAIQLLSGKVLKYENGQICPWLCQDGKELCFPSQCSRFSVSTIGEQVVVFGLTERLCLYCNDRIIVSNCTSYFVHDKYLLVSTMDNNLKLKCYLKKSLVHNYENFSVTEICSQQLERGAQIVVAIPFDTKVVLQMPRGNLEVINPRPLVLSSVCHSLDCGQYRKAFEIAKKHRINLNILYDHDPKVFLDSIETFIRQIDSPTDLNLFLTSLQKEDVSKTMYSFAYPNRSSDGNVDGAKVDLICNTLRDILEKQNDTKYIQTVIATYALKSEPEIDKALTKILLLKEFPEIADDALKFLLYLVDVTELYKVALSTYDFQVAIMVAQKSNMDPKEYLPFLNDLQKLEENYRKYKIDMHLQRYKQALLNISKCAGHFDECISLIKSQRLYTSALFLFPPSSDHFKIVWNEYGNYLMDKMYFNEAGLVYTKAENHKRALEAFQESGDWQLALCAARTLDYTSGEMSLLCQNIASKLKDNQRYEESAHLLEYYVQDIEESIVTLIEGQLWDSALNAMTKYNRLDIAETHLKQQLQDYSQHLRNFIDTSVCSFYQHSERLKVVRKEKEATSLENDGHLDCPEDDLFSDTSSVTGMSSSSKASSKQLSGSLITRKSSRSRRKQELKKYRLKEGSPNEDLALMAELAEIVTKVDKLKDNFFNLLRILVHFDFIKEARKLQQKMKVIETVISAEIPNIWNPESSMVPPSNMQFGPTSTSNYIADVMRKQQKTVSMLSDPELAPPTWRKNMNIFLHCLDQ